MTGNDNAIPPGASVSDQISHAIRLAEAHHLRECQQLLARILKTDPRNHKAWLWYSRVTPNMKHIEILLNNAARLAPQDAEVSEERKKLQLAENTVEGESIRRCPFCWCPMNKWEFQCKYCKAHLLIHEAAFTTRSEMRYEIIGDAIGRYFRIIQKEKNVNAYYNLALAHFNLEHWEEALRFLAASIELAPQNQHLKDQLRALQNHVAFLPRTSIREKSSPSDGTVERQDTLTIDINTFSQTSPPPATEPQPMVSPSDRPKTKKILVVEDSSTTRMVITKILSQKGYTIVEASDGLEALNKAHDESPDLILLDIILPKMTGYDILSVIKRHPVLKNTPVIMLTSRDGFLDKVKGKLAGSTEYLTKPFDSEKLLEAIERYA